MEVVFLFLNLIVAETSYEVVKLPISYKAKQFTCEKAFKQNVIVKKNKDYKPNNNQPIDLVMYKDKPVFAYYCKDKKGNFIKWQKLLCNTE